MEWVKNIIGMKYYWLISNCSFFFCFGLSLLLGINSIFLSLVSFSLLLSYCVFVFCSMLWILLIIFTFIFRVFLLSCIIIFFSRCCLFFLCIFQDSQFSFLVLPTIHLLRWLLSFSIYSPSLLSNCFLFWHGRSSIRTILQFSTPNSSNDFIELGRCFWGFILFIFI